MKKIENLVLRDRSVVTGKSGLEPLFSLKNFPVFFGCVDSLQESDLVADMNWSIDTETGVIQLINLIPLDILYQEQHLDGFGKTWQEYYSNFADYIIKYRPQSVLEIGGGSGVLADLVTSRTVDTKWSIIEPNPLHKESDRIVIIKDLFDDHFHSKTQYDMVVFSQVMEHMYDPKNFLQNISKLLQSRGRLVFAYPNLKLSLEKKFTNALNFEHTMFLTDYFVDYLLLKHQFKILDKTFYKEHSVFYAVKKTSDTLPTPILENKYNEYKKIFMDFVTYHQQLVAELNEKMASAKEPVYLFGAHIFSSFLFAFGLSKDKIITILDNSTLKRDRRFYGTNFTVRSPEILKNKGKVNIIVKAGFYTEEITEQLFSINNKVTIW